MEVIYQIEIKLTGNKFLHNNFAGIYKEWGVYLDFTENDLEIHYFSKSQFENENCIITAKMLHTK